MAFTIDIDENKWSLVILKNLLIDRTTERNIIWGTDDYEYLGDKYNSHFPIEIELITGNNSNIIRPRILKTKEKQGNRTKDKAEVFTPSWICNAQNNLVDNAWFCRDEVFNVEKEKSWVSTIKKIEFPEDKNKTWKNYVDERRLEMTCGEAPYLVSRYDSTTGTPIELNNRIGFLDRKMRVINENTETEEEWLKWAERAFQSIYGFEFQGDSLLIARENLLASYFDYAKERLQKEPPEDELLRIAKIISWNLWQMDGLTYTIPYKSPQEQFEQLSIFEQKDKDALCIIKDWRSKKIINFKDLINWGENYG
ncbi:restriction endonuclease subunit M [Falseniella ignava]|uniref:Restriction endonuclease subunit M n=1 Tax=Falseniella ignava TaxID=137730 RepID=A0A2I1JXV6_9LACT|nr:restriction endonuclease subunit M [Falseniella ignava]PKY88205.1 restriction endonuclease subunit M [Falseniella ignava]